MKAIKDVNGEPFNPTIVPIGYNFGTSGLSFDNYINAYREKGYMV